MRIEFEGTPAQIRTEMLAFLGQPSLVATEEKPASKTKASAKAESPAGSSAPVETPTTGSAESPSDDIALRVKQAAQAFSQKNGRDALVAALKEHGATGGVSSIPDDQREAFIAACEAALG